MKYEISFQEMQKLATEKLSRQSPATLEEKRQQIQNLKNTSSKSRRKSKI